MGDKRIGSQSPTVWTTLPYETSRGGEAVEVYEQTGRACQEWQKGLLDIILAVNEDGLWTHTKYGYSVPRRNGKNEVVVMRELFGLVNGEQILHTAHRTTTSTSSAERLAKMLTLAGYEEVYRLKKNETYNKHYLYKKQRGLEQIMLLDGSKGRCDFRTRTTKGGLGEGFDLLVIDEAQEYTEDQETSLKYVVSDSKNPQTIFCGTPPTIVSSGTVFKSFREKVVSGRVPNGGWAEWSVPEMSDVNDRELWYLCNPSLGSVLSERSVEDEVGSDETDFNIQRLGLWISYNQASAITKAEWERTMETEKPSLQGRLYLGVCYEPNGLSTSLSIACKTDTDRVFVSVYDCRSRYEGDDWIIDFIKNTKSIEKVAIDGKAGQSALLDRLKEEKLSKYAVILSGNDFISACAGFEKDALNGSLAHMPQPSLDEVVTNCEKKLYNSGFTYKPLKEGLEICYMNSLILAHYLCRMAKPKRKQVVRGVNIS